MTRHFSITDLSRLARAFDHVRQPKRYGGRRRWAGTARPKPRPREPQQGELLTRPPTGDS